MKVSLVILASVFFGILQSCILENPKDVLFIGNSLTYYNDMPLTLQAMLNEKGIKINIHQSTFSGVSLSDNLTKSETLTKLNSKNWDYVVLQEATVRVLIDEVIEYNVEPTIIKFDSIIKLKKAKMILYQSYPVSEYPNKYCYPSFLIKPEIPEVQYCSDSLLNSVQEFNKIEASFKRISELITCEIAPVGLSFELCKRKYPELMLFESSSDKHPSRLGSYLIACVFYRHLTGQKTVDINYSLGVDHVDKCKMNELVDSMVLTH